MRHMNGLLTSERTEVIIRTGYQTEKIPLSLSADGQITEHALL